MAEITEDSLRYNWDSITLSRLDERVLGVYSIESIKLLLAEIKRLRTEIAERSKDTERLDWLENWLVEDPKRYQIALRRMETDGTFITALHPNVEKVRIFSGKNGFGRSLRAAIDAAKEKHA